MSNSFLPEGYVAPSGNGDYMKFATGENKFRILSRPIIFWQDWTLEKKPVRFPFDKKPAQPISPDKPIKFCWALLLWNYNEKKLQIIEITQKSVQSAIEALSKDSSWGDPFKYDIKVTKTGSNLETEYVTTPLPPTPLCEEAKVAYKAKPCVLANLLIGADPFLNSSKPLTQEVIVAAALATTAPIITESANNGDDLPF